MANKRKPEVIVVTGASAGIGRAIVRRFAREGAHIGLLARGEDGLEGARLDVETGGGKAIKLAADVADAEQVESAAGAVENEFGPIDIWINNAMTSVFSPFLQMTPDEFRRVTEVTYLGYVHGTMAALKRMIPRNQGVVVQVGSALAYRGIPLQSAYCGAKHAIQGFTESVRSELMHDGSNVRLVEVHMPAVNTPQFGWVKSRLPHKAQPVPPIFQPELAANAVYWAAHNDRRELFVTMSTWRAIVGNKFLPNLGDWVLARNGYQGQQTDEPADPNQPYNLWEPIPGDHGAHGAFDDRAKTRSLQLWIAQHRNIAGLLFSGLLGTFLWRTHDDS
jgi:NAD(P)-dependent dehydrogenase (short-subunit alcohol dehydrogenase family)